MSATVVVQFGKGADSNALVKIELDGAVNLDASGTEKTTFEPGDQPVFLVHHEPSLVIAAVSCSSGSIQDLGMVERERSQRMQWQELQSQELEYLPSGRPTITWFGNDAGLSVVGRTLTPSGVVPAVCDIAMVIAAHQYRLIPPDIVLAEEEDYPILIVVTMEAA